MSTITMDFRHHYQRGERREAEQVAYQWDLGHVAEIFVPLDATYNISYCFSDYDKTDDYAVESITAADDGGYKLTAHVPNKYFERSGELRVYIIGEADDHIITTYEGFITIRGRIQPDDYVDDDPENGATHIIEEAQKYATKSESFAVGGTGTRLGEDTDNAKYYLEQAEAVAESIPEDYSELSDDVSQLKNALNITESEWSVTHTTSSNTWEIMRAGLTLKTGETYIATFSLMESRSLVTSFDVSYLPEGASSSTIVQLVNIAAGDLTGSVEFTYSGSTVNIGRLRVYTASNTPCTVTGKLELKYPPLNKIDVLDDKMDCLLTELELNTNKVVLIMDPDNNPSINTSNGVPRIDSASGWDCIVTQCAAGDTFIINGQGGSGNYRLYGFIGKITSSVNKMIVACDATISTNGMTNGTVIAPGGAKYAIFNLKHVNGIENHVYKRNEQVLLDLCEKVQDGLSHIRFMVFGNSYGMDSITYVPFILKNLGITSEIYLYRRDGCSLRDIYNRWTSSDATDTETDGIHAGTYGRTVYKIDTRTDKSWQTNARISMKDCVELGGWDFITLQQWSAYSIDASTYTPWLPLVIDKIRQSVDSATMLAWTQVCTRASHDDQQASLQVFKEVPYGEYPFDFYIPYGTAIFNARANATLAELGDYSEHNFWKDGIHLQDGLPRYIAALTVCEAICRKFFPKKSVMYDKTRPTDDAISSWGNNMPMTPSVGITEENCLLAQYSAINACNHMFEIIPTKSLPSVPST